MGVEARNPTLRAVGKGHIIMCLDVRESPIHRHVFVAMFRPWTQIEKLAARRFGKMSTRDFLILMTK